MQKFYACHEYVDNKGIKLFTVVMQPDKEGKFPVVIKRSPYVSNTENMDEVSVVNMYLKDNEKWLKRGYAVIMQHCRGRGKSEGDCIPFINEREDSLNLYEYARNCSFYNGEIFLWGGSYCCEVHYLASPYPDDIKGAVFRVKDTERYNFAYRNGFFKKGLMGDWYVTELYNKKPHTERNYTKKSFDILPLSKFSETVFGHAEPEFDEMLKHPDKNDEYWKSASGGIHIKDAIKDVHFPVLLETSLYDIFAGGVFDTWNGMTEHTKNNSAFLVSAYDHPDNSESSPIHFPQASRNEWFGKDYDVEWFDYIRGKREAPFKTGKITYYNLFYNKWLTDEFYTSKELMKIRIGEENVSYTYNPFDAPEFPGGLSTNFGGVTFQNPANSRFDVITVYTEPFNKDIMVKGKMKAELTVSSDCPDTCFYMRISIEKPEGDYGLRDDITSLCYQLGSYTENTKVKINFTFDEHAFLIKKNERLRIDISSADNNNYVRHTNNKGLYSEHSTARVAKNTVYLKESYIELPF